jgi:Der1-like family
MSGNQNRPGAAQGLDDFDFKSFVNDIPPVTRTLVLSTFMCTLGSGFGLLPSSMFDLIWPQIIGKFHFWRMFFSFLHLGKLGFPFLINIYFLYNYSKQLENGFFLGRLANYCWFLVIVMGITLVVSVFMPMHAAGPALLMAIMHVWGRHSPTLTVRMYGFISIPAKYLSLAILALDLILTGGFDITAVVGLVAGHAYYFLDSVYPTMPSGKQMIFTPPAFQQFVDQACVALSSATGLGAVPPPPAPSRTTGGGTMSNMDALRSGSNGAASTGTRSGITMPNLRGATGGHSWGTGQTLGTS